MSEVIRVLDHEMVRLEYWGGPVVTARQIDEAHQKADGQALRQFHRNRSRFIEKADFFEIPYETWSGQLDWTKSESGGHGGHRGAIVAFTERGYGKIVKGWRDDRSWRLHDAMQDAYFREKEAKASAPRLSEVRSEASVFAFLKDISGGIGGLMNNLATYKKSTVESITNLRNDVTDINKTIAGLTEQFTSRVKASSEWREDFLEEMRKIRDRSDREPPAPYRPFYHHEWLDIDRIYRTYKPDVVIPRRGFLSNAISKQLSTYCKRTDRQMDMRCMLMGGRYHDLWHKDAVAAWHHHEGQYLIENHFRNEAEKAGK